ncbi:TPA: DUF2946 domain-containing protein [Pseudomonas aeruginosa]
MQYVWLACFAVLFNLLAMSQCRTMPAPQADLVLWGGFCGGGGQAQSPIVIKSGKGGVPGNASHGLHEEGCCCTQGAGTPPLATHYRPLPPQVVAAASITRPVLPWLPAYLRWPALNPRASPIA